MRNKWLFVTMMLALVLIVAGCSAPEEVTVDAVDETSVVETQMPDADADNDVIAEEVSEEAPEAVPEEMVEGADLPEADVEDTDVEDAEEIVLGMLSADAVLAKDELAPDFALKTLEGEVVKLSDYRGKLVLINFWTTW